MDKEIIQRARQADLAQYLISIGVPLIRNGNRYKHKEHDSLTFTENAYYWNSQQEHGNSIDYLVKHMNMSFVNTVSALNNFSISDYQENNMKVKSHSFDFNKLDLNINTDKIKKYLNKTRFIGYSIINYHITNKLLFQEIKTNNAIFAMYDENNNCVGAEVQGIVASRRFKGIKSNSKYGYGFNVRLTNNGNFDYAMFFESAVDLISYMDYKLNCEKKTLKRCLLVSMAGLKVNVFKHMLTVFEGKLKPVICVDNDDAGKAFIKELEREKVGFMLSQPDNKYKDWNEQIVAIRKSSMPISRLMERGSSLQNVKLSGWEGKIEISEDFNETIEEFKEYM